MDIDDVITMSIYIVATIILFYILLFFSLLSVAISVLGFSATCALLGYMQARIERCYIILLIGSIIALPIIFVITINLPGYPFFPVFTSTRKLGILGNLNPNYYMNLRGSLETYNFMIFQFVLLYIEVVLVIALISSAVGGLFSEVR
jgi:hypothetical protein